jgi:Tol biopolymer transport system component
MPGANCSELPLSGIHLLRRCAMKKSSGTFWLVIALFLAAATASAQRSKPETVYQQALYEMEGLGNYSRAIQLFNQLLNQFPKEKSTAARALLQIGVCYEKLGQENQEKAAEAYQKVIDIYSDQTDAVEVARHKLATLQQVQQEKNGGRSGVSLRQLPFKQLNTPFARLSPDGTKIAYVEYAKDSRPNRIRLLDLNSGIDRALVEGKVGGLYSFVWSPDNKNLAYMSGGDLREIAADSGVSKLLWKHTDYSIAPFSWSRDGKTILCGLTTNDSRQHVALLSVSTGEIHIVLSGATSEFQLEGKLSPDGKYVVYPANRRGNTDVYVWSLDGKREVRLTDDPARDDNPQWSPDGKYIVFLSDRAKSIDLWAIRMRDGVSSGPPVLVKRDIGWRTLLFDFVACGKLHMLMVGGGEPRNLVALPIDGGKGVAQGGFVSISKYPTDHFQPRWSPKGDMVAYTSRKGQVGWPRLFVLNDDGTERELALRGHYATSVAWHPNGTHLLFVGWDSSWKAGLYQISTATQEISIVCQGERIERGSFAGALVNLHYLPASRKLMYFKLLGGPDTEAIACNVDGANLHTLLSRVRMPMWGWPAPDGAHVSYLLGDTLKVLPLPGDSSKAITVGSPVKVGGFSGWSPDGSQLLWMQRTKLNLYFLHNGQSRTLHEVAGTKSLVDAIWSPDGSQVVFVVSDSAASAAHEIYVLDQRNASVRKLSDAPNEYPIITDLQWSPGGTQILASGETAAGSQAPIYEYWIMENFLPKGVEGKE